MKKIFNKNLKRKFIYTFIIFSCVIYSIFYLYESFYWIFNVGADCYINRDINENIIKLEDILESKKKPTPGKSIFFHETSCLKDGLIKLNARQACAIESAAKVNPDWDVFILFASSVGYENNTKIPIIEALKSYSNIHLRNVNLWNYAQNTPVENWFNDGQIFHSKYMNSHVSDFLRYLSLYKYGGTYLDLDVIVKQSFNKLLPNYAGAESDRFVAAGVINFSNDGFGHEISEMCIRDFLVNFDGRDWGNNGPGVITRVLHKICLTKNPLYMDRIRCKGFQVYPINTFYAIKWKNWDYFFTEDHLDEVFKITNNSILIHVWNKFSIKKSIKVGSKVAYALFANKYCPEVYKSCGEYF